MGVLREFYGSSSAFPIQVSCSFAIRSFDRSLFTHLLDFYRVRYSLTCWISIALLIQSLDCTLHDMVIRGSPSRSLVTSLRIFIAPLNSHCTPPEYINGGRLFLLTLHCAAVRKLIHRNGIG